MTPRKPKQSEEEKQAGRLGGIIASIILFAKDNPKTIVTVALLLSGTGAFSAFTANFTSGKSRDTKIDSAITLQVMMYTEIKAIRHYQTKHDDSIRVLSGTIGQMSGGLLAKTRYMKIEQDARRVLGVAGPLPALPAPEAPVNYVSKPQPRRNQ